MIQINTEYAGSIYLPYAVGCIAAYAWSNDTVKENYCLKPFIYQRHAIDDLLNQMEAPSIAAFSVYIWNFEFSKAFARKLKNKYPDCIVIFGGHSTPCTTSFLDEHTYIDYLVRGEGEKPFTELLCALLNKSDLGEVSNIIYKSPSGKATKSKERISTEIDFPSPYTEGYFDDIVSGNHTVKFSAIVETNRGCPYCCSYCDWGVLNKKVKIFIAEKVNAEIDWLCAHKIEYLYFADANFGMFQRDLIFAKKIANAYSTCGFPKKFFVNYTKCSNLRVFEINKLLHQYGLSKGATLSFQSLSPHVLKNIHRTNMNFQHFSELMTLYNTNNIMSYSELILGLPGETYDSFAMALGKLLEAGQHTSIIVVKCHCLVNAEMGDPDYMKKHKIEIIQAPIDNAHFIPQQEDNIPEFSQIVVSTATMSREMWVETELLSMSVQCFHSFGLLRYFAIYLFYESGIKYEVFYQNLIAWLKDNSRTVSGNIFADMQMEITKSSQGKGAWFHLNKNFGNITWPYEEGMFLELAYISEIFYEEIADFLKNYHLEQILFDELVSYQKFMLKLPGKTAAEHRFKFDFNKYFAGIYSGCRKKLEADENTIKINSKSVPDKWDQYGIEVVWFGRRGGNTLYTDIEQTFS